MSHANGTPKPPLPASAFAGDSLTRGRQRPVVLSGRWLADRDHRTNPLRSWEIDAMLQDGQVAFSEWCKFAPLPTVTWSITCADDAAAELADVTFRRCWERHVRDAFMSWRYGHAGGEVTYKSASEDPDDFAFDEILPAGRGDVRLLQADGRNVAITTAGKTLYAPRYWFCAHDAQPGQPYGISGYGPLWKPWMEKAGRHGAEDIVRQWYLKNAYRGDRIRHPGGTYTDAEGNERSNEELARELAERRMTGGVMTLPNTRQINPDGSVGDPEWTIEDATSLGDCPGILDYLDKLDIRILKAAGIPPEVVAAAESGSGWSGRSVPFLMFLKAEDYLADLFARSFVECIVRPLVEYHHGRRAAESLEVKLDSLVQPEQEQEGGKDAGADAGMAGAMQGGQESGEAPAGGPERMSLDASVVRLAADPWVAFEGKRGGKGWRNSQTGRVVYGAKKPAVRDRDGDGKVGPAEKKAAAVPQAKPQSQPAAPAPKAAAKPAAPKADPAAARGLIAKAAAGQSSLEEVSKALASLSQADINALKKELGQKAGGTKVAQAAKLAAWALGQGAHPGQARPPAKPAGPQPPTAKPAQQPAKPAAGVRAAGNPDNVNHHALLPVHAAMASLPPHRREMYTEFLSRAVRHMPPNALRDLHEGGLTGAAFYGSPEELTDSIFARFPDKLAELKARRSTAAGAYGGGRLHLDGDAKGGLQGRYAEGVSHGEAVYAHELMHAIDGDDYFYSSSPEWQACWKEEITGQRLTDYAATQPQEAFAEFGRVLYTSEIDTQAFAREFPKCAAYFRERGLWPEQERTAARHVKPEDLFGERLAIPGGKPSAHADKLKKVPPVKPGKLPNRDSFKPKPAAPRSQA